MNITPGLFAEAFGVLNNDPSSTDTEVDGMPKQDIGLGNAESGPLEIIVTEEKIPNYDKK